MSILVDDTASQWIFSRYDTVASNMSDAGWHQLADDPPAVTSGDYNGTAIWTTTPGASASLVFQGVDVYLYSTIHPQGGLMSVSLDSMNTSVSLDWTVRQPGEIVYNWTDLDPGTMHAITIQMVGGGRINIDKVGINPGPPSAFPPVMPQPLPSAFPNATSTIVTNPATTVTQTITPTMTTSVPQPAQRTSQISKPSTLNKGMEAGLVVAGVFAVAFLVVIFFLARRCASRRTESEPAGSGGLRQLYLALRRKRNSVASVMSKSSFVRIDDEEMLENFEGRPKFIRPASSIHLFDQPTTTSSPSSSRTMLSQFPVPPPSRTISPTLTHGRNRSIALSLSINTNVDSAQATRTADTFNTSRRSRVKSLRRDIRVPLQSHRRTVTGLSSLDHHEAVQGVDSDAGLEDRDGRESLEFYAAYARSDHHFMDEDEGIEEEADGAEDSEDGEDNASGPLIPISPAVASSNASLSHGSGTHLHGSRFSLKGNKVLRSMRSRSSMRSTSLRHSLGMKSSRSSMTPKTPDSKTPVSMSASGSGESPLSGASRKRMSSILVTRNLPAPLPTQSQSAVLNPEGGPMEQASQTTSTTTWDGTVASSSQNGPTKLGRSHRPFYGPRARSMSNGSVASGSGSSGNYAGLVAPRNDDAEALSIVEEGSLNAPVTERASESLDHASSSTAAS
ncbi:hypothetical protein EW145_g2738 [Phellinidium pouzarii]|uniref:Transmembrane protein n=1 Tax=Phellinidium pouzarii TaxID=167371 RepID=A0A4S4LA68_9AGAM|nr:hypothetical protein EW145_g2738 [Phellinidium pouzarii]